jgi:hypothetical protein
MSIRKTTSLTLLISFVPLLFTSIVLYVVPEGRVAYWSNWRFWGLTKNQWGDIHINLGFLFLAAGCLHLFFNWTPIVAYLKNKARDIKIFTPAFSVALLINLMFTVGTLTETPPFSTILELGKSFKEAAAVKYGEPPYGHAELSSLTLFAKRTGLELATMKTHLNEAKIRFTGEDQAILEIAKANSTTPKAIYDAMNPPVSGVSNEKKPFPQEPFPGMGRMVLQDLCNQYGLNTVKVIQALAARSIKADPAQSLKDIAAANGSDPHALFEIIHETATHP